MNMHNILIINIYNSKGQTFELTVSEFSLYLAIQRKILNGKIQSHDYLFYLFFFSFFILWWKQASAVSRYDNVNVCTDIMS